MIVSTSDLAGLAGTVTMVDGGFDPIHHGHVAYLRAAAELGLPVLCSVSSDEWVRKKHPVLLRHAERGAVIDAIRWVEYTHLSNISTSEVLRRLRPAVYAKGADWRGRLPQAELDQCADAGIRIVFLDVPVASSSDLVRRFAESLSSHG